MSRREIVRYDSETPDAPNDSDPPDDVSVEIEPFDGDAAYTLGQVMRAVTGLQHTIGGAPSRTHPKGTGLMRQVHDLKTIIGSSPDEATGSRGTGLRGEVANLVRAKREQTSTIIKSVAAASVAIFGIVEALSQLAKVLH